MYGDNAYVNDSNMAGPYPNQGCGPKDDFNFFHSQVWINIECTFGILSNHWHILKNALSSTLSIKKVIALTNCLCHLHNFCIDNGSAKVPARYEHDVLTLMDFADVPIGDSAEDVSPVSLLGGGKHFDDIDGGRRGVTTRAPCQNERGNPAVCMPRTLMLQHVIEWDIHRQQPITSSL